MAKQVKPSKKKRTTAPKFKKKSIKNLVLAAIFGILSALGAAHYYYDLKPLLDIGAEYVEDLFNKPLRGNVLSISDGDTITLLDSGGNEIKVRLYGIDAPESTQRYGESSRQALKNMIYGKDIKLTVINTDQYGRSVGILETEDGRNINKQMLMNGHAWYYGTYCKKSFCREWRMLAEQAKFENKGLWQQSKPTPPWEYRKK